jgi:hypothetical protein
VVAVAVVGDAEVDREVILGAAFGNRVIEVASEGGPEPNHNEGY